MISTNPESRQSRCDVRGEAADLLFHLMVLLAEKGVPIADVLAELDRREGRSGVEDGQRRVPPPPWPVAAGRFSPNRC